MRFLLLLILISFTQFSLAGSESLEKKKYYYSALNEFFIETYGQKITQPQVERLEKLLFFTGIEILEDYDAELLERYPTSSTRFILARRLFQKKDYNRALDYINKVHSGHRYYPESLLLKAQVYADQNILDKELRSYSGCQVAAEKEEKKSKFAKKPRKKKETATE